MASQFEAQARERVVAAFPHLQARALDMAIGYQALLEEIDADFRAKMGEQPGTATALVAWQRDAPNRHRDWLARREPVERAFARFLELFPPPLIVMRP